MLCLDTKFAETADKYILPGFQSSLDDFQEVFNCVERLLIWITVLFSKRLGNVGLREGHYKVPLLNLVVISSAYIHSHVKVKICQENKQVNF